MGYFFESGVNPQKLYKTIDGGRSWTLTRYPANYVQVLKFYDRNIGLAVPGGDGIYRTLYGGNTWDSIPIPSRHWGEAFSFAPGNPAKVWFLDSDDLYFSSDTGRTWTAQLHMPWSSGSGRDVVFTDAQNGWLLGDKDILYRTTNGGVTTGIDEQPGSAPSRFTLFPNYPNPFNPTTTITFTLPHSTHATLKVFTPLGIEIATLVSGIQSAGAHQVQWNATGKLSGVYFYRLEAGGYVETRKLILLR